MAFGTKADLASAIADWLQRNNLTARIPDFIRLAEARLNRLLRDPDQLVTTTINMTGGMGSLPTDFGQLVAFGDQGYRLKQVTPGEFGSYWAVTGYPSVYTVSGGQLKVLPVGGSANTPITYYRSIVPLVNDSDANWLLTRAPDVYLYACLVQAEGYGWNDERVPMIKNLLDEAISELRADGADRRWGAAPLAAKVRRT